MSKRIIAVALIVSLFALPAAAHELTIKNTAGNSPKAGEPFALTVQSAHKFIVPEEVEILSRVKAGIIEDGKFIESELKGNDPELCIDFSVTPKDLSGSFIVVATKDGESRWDSNPRYRCRYT